MDDFIKVRGARENNLKNISVDIPRNKLVLFTGLSGSGKSSLAFDTIFAEGQRKYMESLSSYARMFLGQMEKPDVDKIENLSPAIAINQKTTSKNPRSTVGTVTEIYDYFRLLFANIGEAYCPNCGNKIDSLSVDQIVDRILKYKDGEKVVILAPVVRKRKGEYQKLLESLKKSGFVRVYIDGIMYGLDEDINIDKNQKHNISVVVDRLILRDEIKSRLTQSVESALKLADDLVCVLINDEEILYSARNSCSECGFSFGDIVPTLFSFNSPSGACPDCSGLGIKEEIDPKLLIPNKSLSLSTGAISTHGWVDPNYLNMQLRGLSKHYGFSMETPVEELPKQIQDILLYGSDEKFEISYSTANFSGSFKGHFDGLVNLMNKKYHESSSDFVRSEIEKYMIKKVCPTCKGQRLNMAALSIKIDGKNISEVCDMNVTSLFNWIDNLNLTTRQKKISEMLLKEIRARLKFLIDVGLDYLTLSRAAGTLSGGEAQRIRLATQIGSGLVGVLYILDEPSIGLHPRDTEKLIKTLRNLQKLGNSVFVVEHDEETIREADFIVDIGPKAGEHGGEVVVAGTLDEVMACEKSKTGDYLSGRRKIEVPKSRRKVGDDYLTILGAKEHNLKNIDVSIPLKVMTAISGVSGSGKSSLINDILVPALANRLNGSSMQEGNYEDILGVEKLDKAIIIDQSPIGRTPRSNPATYTGIFTPIRELFASLPDSKAKGYTAARFSFNVKGGRCEVCGGDGVNKIEMHFLPDVYVTCEECNGKRYNRETLEIKYKGKNIADVLDMTVDEAYKYFDSIPQIKNKLQALVDVGLGYIRLGQSATTLSGGEAQRVKLATEMAKRPTGKTVYILDEPTTGLHTYDVDKLIKILNRLVSKGNSVIVIEHNVDVLKSADYIIDLGPEGGNGGGTIVAEGTPEELAENKKSYTGAALRKVLGK